MTARLRLLAIVSLLPLIGACESLNPTYDFPGPRPKGTHDGRPASEKDRQTVWGDSGLFGGNLLNMGRGGGGGEGGGIGVNSFLWRATLDTLAFMPLASADPFGGVIITDWYSPPEAPQERFKMTVYILDRQLRADGLKVAAFKQIRSGEQWADAGVSADTVGNLENAILRRARQLRSDVAQQ